MADKVIGIKIQVDTKGSPEIEKIAKQLGLLTQSSKKTAGTMGMLGTSLKGLWAYMAAQGLGVLVKTSDEMHNLANRLSIIVKDGQSVDSVMQSLLSTANELNQSVTGVAQIYTRLGAAMGRTNVSSEQLLALTKTLINTFRVAGATTTETVNTVVQLSQAFASGELRGQELRSVLEQNAYMADLLYKRFGKDIFKKAQDGAIGLKDVVGVLVENFDDLQSKADKLTPTFEQSMTKAFNAVQISIYKIAKDQQLQKMFADLVEVSIPYLEQFGTALGDVIRGAGNAFRWLYDIGSSFFNWLNGTFYGKILLIPSKVGANIAGMLLGLDQAWTNFFNIIRKGQSYLYKLAAALEWVGLKMVEFTTDDKGFLGKVDMNADMAKRKKQVEEYKKLAEEYSKAVTIAENPVGKRDDKGALTTFYKSLNNSTKEKAEKLKDILAKLNKEWLSGSISLAKYNEELMKFEVRKVTDQLTKGSITVFEYTEKMRELAKTMANMSLSGGFSSFTEFTETINSMQMDTLNEKLAAGRISLIEYNKELLPLMTSAEWGPAFSTAMVGIIDDIGTTSENIAQGITTVFSHLEDSFMDFIEKGKFEFNDFAGAVIKDINRIIFRAMIIQPLAKGLLNLTGPNNTGSTWGYDQQPINEFAKGGVVDSPSFFGYGNGKMGVAGEAGAEAIMPLRRGSNGDLGVAASVTPVNINIINQSNAQIQQSESTGPNGEKTISLLIHSKVREGLSTGMYDKDLRNSFNLTRKGV